MNTAELHFGPGSKLTVLGKGAQLGVRECVVGRDGKRGQRPSSVLGCAQRRAAPGPGTPGSGRGRSDGGVQGGWGPGRVRGSGRVFVPGLGAVSTDKQYFGSGTRLTVLGKRDTPRAGFCAGPGGRDGETQYFGSGTRLLVLGERLARRAPGFCGEPRGCALPPRS